ncbi:MAG: MiaB/RimO family radical SAM methylthiotransferase, partial [Abditibacteriota bacterium]|nr:MiaB/RimO family radical SAM methylthiotransferase [Abditibacteriota bacterium]
AYCVVPYVRGRERSRRPEDIVNEIKYLAERGTEEVTLLGQNVNSYGATADFDTDFADLLAMVNDVEGIERVRFTTSHPKDLSDRVIKAMAELPKVCEHIHLAVQSGDDDTLKAMNRGYTADRLRERIGALRAAVPDVAVTTDFLIGFPGETEEGLERTLAFAEEIRFDGAFMFSYNIIPGTAAEKMTGHMTMPEKNRRLERLIEIQNRITCEINRSRVGDVFEVLVDGASKDGDMVSGFTRQNKIVNFPGSKDLIGRLVKVKITEGRLFGFMGEMI